MFILLLSIIFLFVGSESAKILGVFPTPSISHQVVFRPLMLELSKRGHEVTVITTDPAYSKDQAPTNLTEIDVHDVSYEYWNKFIDDKGHEEEPILYITLLCDVISNLVEKQLKTDEVQKFLRDNKKFDLVFVESFIRPIHIFSHIFDAPLIEFSSISGILSAFDRVGAATHPFIYPNVLRRRIHNLTLWEKITEFNIYYTTERIFKNHVHSENEMLKKIFGPDIPELDDLKQNVQMLFLNVHPIWDLNRPVPPNVIYLGGLHQKPKQEISKDLQSYLDSSENGVIYLSFGTNVRPSSFSSKNLKIFTDVFSKLPYEVLWKWDDDEIQGRPENVKISKWLPQADLLRHPKVKLFITQGGLQSTDEAITAGVPLIGIPMLGDQWFNVEQYVKLNIGKQLLLETLTEDQLMDAIQTVINDESYWQNVITLRNIMHDQPQPPLERAVWWTEHVLRHGRNGHLRAPGSNKDWTDYYELKIVFLIISLSVIVSIVITIVLFKLSKHLIASTRNIRSYVTALLDMRKNIKVN